MKTQDANKSGKANQKPRDANSMDNASNPSSGYGANTSEAVVPAIGKKKKVETSAAKRRETMKNPSTAKTMITSKESNSAAKARKSVKEFNTPKVASDTHADVEELTSPAKEDANRHLALKNLDSAEKRKRASSQQEDSKSKQNSNRQSSEVDQQLKQMTTNSVLRENSLQPGDSSMMTPLADVNPKQIGGFSGMVNNLAKLEEEEDAHKNDKSSSSQQREEDSDSDKKLITAVEPENQDHHK